MLQEEGSFSLKSLWFWESHFYRFFNLAQGEVDRRGDEQSARRGLRDLNELAKSTVPVSVIHGSYSFVP